jgi:hypothetical protein
LTKNYFALYIKEKGASNVSSGLAFVCNDFCLLFVLGSPEKTGFGVRE